MADKVITLAELPKYLQEHVLAGNTVEMVIRKGTSRSVLARLSFRTEIASQDEVRIPCIVVPESVFQKNAREKNI